MFPIDSLGSFQGLLADTAALAAVALIGYLFGRRTRTECQKSDNSQLLSEVSRATRVARELQCITNRIREDLALHQANVNRFKSRLNNLPREADNAGWSLLSREAEELLTPTMKLASDLSLAYDELRKQSHHLMVFTGSRIDQEMGICNRRAMEEQLAGLLSVHERTAARFSLALFAVDGKTGSVSKAQLYEFASLLERTARDTDVVARYSADEFVVLMPHTSLAGATVFGQRLVTSAKESAMMVCGGVVEVQEKDTSEKLLSRADSALYSARSDGVSCLYQHTGKAIRPHDKAETAPHPDGESPASRPEATEIIAVASCS